MKKKIVSFLALSSLVLAANSNVIKESKIFVKDGKAYTLGTEKAITGVILKEKDGLSYYTTYKKGVKLSEKILNSNREVVGEYNFDENGLVTGKVLYTDSYGIKSESNYLKGLRTGYSKAEYYEDLDYQGDFNYGIAHGKMKYMDVNYILQDKVFADGAVVTGNVGQSVFKPYFDMKFYKQDKITLKDGKATIDNKSLTGTVISEKDGVVDSATSYKNGLKIADFKFNGGFMTEAKVYGSSESSYKLFTFGSLNFLSGVLTSTDNCENNKRNGMSEIFYEDGWKFHGSYKDDLLDGTAHYYDENGILKYVYEYKNNTYKAISYFDYNKKTVESTFEGKYTDKDGWIKSGKAIYYTEDGKVEEEIVYDGYKGYTKFYYPSGKLKMEGYVSSLTDYYEGEFKEYYENGTLKTKWNYAEGYLNGKQFYYDEKGNQTKVEEYDYGYIINN